MKSVLISIQPKWCELIASGEKTIEVRKTRPKLETPFKCYIYETKAKSGQSYFNVNHEKTIGKVIGEFVCDRIYTRLANTIYLSNAQKDYLELLKMACLTEKEVLKYMGGQYNKDMYFWHISDLKIYDTPKELGEFRKSCPFPAEDCDLFCPYALGEYHGDGINGDVEFIGCGNKLTRPPQSWRYVEEVDL